MDRPIEFSSLVEMSARIGAEPALIQGPGGNTSLKSGDNLWVKASGRWLAEAGTQDIFALLSLRSARAQLQDGQADDFSSCVTDPSLGELKPSIETAFHAMLPHRVVVHAHGYNSVATSVLADGPVRFDKAIAPDLRGAWVPYRRPGGPLAAAIATALSGGCVDVILLQNHGVIVGGDSAEEAEALLREVERRLELPIRSSNGAETAAPAVDIPADFEPDTVNSDAATDPKLLAIIGQVVLVPDQVVFLGGAACIAQSGSSIGEAASAAQARTGIRPALVLVPGVGAFRWTGRSRAADSLIDGIIAVARRVPADIAVHGLSQSDVGELLGWDAEHYRQRLDQKLD